jgi:hypothetical protein
VPSTTLRACTTTGLGNVVHDFSEAASADGSQVKGFDFRQQKKRTEMLLDYIVDFEHGAYLLPRSIPSQAAGHQQGPHAVLPGAPQRHQRDVFAPSKWDAHLPDDFAAMAMAHRSAGKVPNVTAQGVPKGPSPEPRKVEKQFSPPDAQQSWTEMGGVTVVDERYDDQGTFWISPGVES